MDLTLNGEPVSVELREGETLLELLREELGLWSMKDGCAPEGMCGACTVIVDGRPVVSCAQPASRFEGKAVVTQEGLSEETRRLWAECFVAAGASQCGFCSPGIVMKAEGFLDRNPEPSREEVSRALLGNLCRCTGYIKIVDAILFAAAAKRGEPLPELDHSGRVGTRAPRYAGVELALGDEKFVADMNVPGLLHCALRFSDHPRARVLSIDTAKAESHPGVVAVLTAKDVPGERTQGALTQDWRQLVAVGEETAYVGDVLAVVAAETLHAAREATELVEVEYEVLDPVVSPFDERARVLSQSFVKRGDVDAALTESAHVVQGHYRTQFIEHAFLEPEASLAVPENGGFHVYSQGQGVWEDRRQVASFLGLTENAVRVTQVSAGGAFGAKEDLNVQAHAALIAHATGRPARVVFSRAESMRFHAKRHPMWLDYTVGCDAEGRLTAVRARITGDSGAYASVGDKVLERAAGHACGPYAVQAVDVESTAVYTNNPPCGAMRGFGVNQTNFAIEGLLDRLAAEVGIDGWEMRWRNALDTGDRFGTGQKLGPGVGLKKTLLAVKDAYREARYAGIACCAKNTGIGNGVPDRGRVVLRVEEDGNISLFHSWTEMGQGVHTVLRQMLCETLGLPPDRIRVYVDTERELDTGQTTASRATVLGGQAVLAAAEKLKGALNGQPLEALAGQEFPGEFVVDWTTTNEVDEPVTHLAYAWGTQVAILDDEGRLTKVVAAHDVGRAINPTLVEGQIEGAVHMGLGHALSEEFVVEGGVPITTTLKSLHIVPSTGMPDVECILVEEPQPEGPFGAKGIGEAALVPTASAVRGALEAFDGIHRTELPMKDSPAARAAVPKLVKAGA
ncbi:MAG: selenium-dependent xanthine dehydrogenase [Gaiellaceae bacterium]